MPKWLAEAAWHRKKETHNNSTTSYYETRHKATIKIIDSASLQSAQICLGYCFLCELAFVYEAQSPTDRPCPDPLMCKMTLITCSIITGFPSCQSEIHHSMTIDNCTLKANANVRCHNFIFHGCSKASQQNIYPLIHDQELNLSSQSAALCFPVPIVLQLMSSSLFFCFQFNFPMCMHFSWLKTNVIYLFTI